MKKEEKEIDEEDLIFINEELNKLMTLFHKKRMNMPGVLVNTLIFTMTCMTQMIPTDKEFNDVVVSSKKTAYKLKKEMEKRKNDQSR